MNKLMHPHLTRVLSQSVLFFRAITTHLSALLISLKILHDITSNYGLCTLLWASLNNFVFLPCLQHAENEIMLSPRTTRSVGGLRIRHLDGYKNSSRTGKIRYPTGIVDQEVGIGITAKGCHETT